MNVEIAQRLAEMRREKGFSQEELAARLGLSRQAVSKWERAESSPDTGNLIALADLYGVTLDELVRVEADIADDVTFESSDRAASAEVEAREAATAAAAAAATAAAAAAAAQAAARPETRQSTQPATSQTASAPAQQPAPASAPRQSAASATACQPGSPFHEAGARPAAPSQPDAASAAAGSTGPAPHPCTGAPVPPPPHGYAPVQQPGYGASVPPQQPAGSYDAPDGRRRHSPWMTFPYPVLCVILFLLVGFLFGAWHPAWVIFLTIPLYYWIARIIENDPNYRAGRR
ncbi:helix-turn-helix domain-containing protein [Gordonibacter urolithinfaciens]|uniref:helix-turn-helix domain-containing protein n=1 Tax=Gordonibacter urolithinfaciens TaxID=1335613 RepID=UPI003A9401E3